MFYDTCVINQINNILQMLVVLGLNHTYTKIYNKLFQLNGNEAIYTNNYINFNGKKMLCVKCLAKK